MGLLFFAGDSITTGKWDSQNGWVSRLTSQIMDLTIKDNFKERGFICTPYNLAIDGSNLGDISLSLEPEVRTRIEKDPNEKVQLVISAGVNDSLYLLNEQRPAFTDQQFKENLLKVINSSRKFADDISFIGLLPVNDDILSPIPWAPGKSYANIHVERFENIIRDTCQAEGIKFFPMFERWGAMPDYKSYLIDGIHPNTAGHALMAEQIKDFLITDDFIKLHSGA